jgi:asparagine synthase (glutamine-hydrolysing)
VSGICAIVHLDGRPADPRALQRMVEAAPHRGRDGVATWSVGPAALAHQSTIVAPHDPPSPQPLVRDGLVLVADARIDNRDDLVPLLRAKRLLGRADDDDASVVLAAHRHWGHEAPAHLIGDFAYAVYDVAQRSLVAARDPLGMRVLHVHATDALVVLATEVEQVLAHPDVPVALFEPMVAAHLAGPYGRDGWTFYAGIDQVAPGHALHAAPGVLRRWRAWSLDPSKRVRHRDEDAYAEELRALLRRSVADRSRGGTPVGLMLSGGLDSGSIASTLGMLDRGPDAPPVHTYSWAFESAELAGGDERGVSDGIVDRFGFVPRAIVADELWPLQGYPDHGPARAAPYVLPYQPMFDRGFDMAASDGVRSMWCGDRGDEMLGDWVFDHAGMLRSGRWRAVAEELRTHAALSRRAWRSVAWHELVLPLRDDLLKIRRGGPDAATIARRTPPYLRADWAERVGLPDTMRGSDATADGLDAARRARFARVFYFRGIRDPSLHEGRMARRGLTFVDPFADRRIAEFVLAVPTWLLQRPSEPKRLLRRAMRGVMPEAALTAAKKTEPASLHDRGLKERGRTVVLDLLTDMESDRRGYVDEGALRAAYHAYLGGRSMRHDLWWALTLEMWLRRYWT